MDKLDKLTHEQRAVMQAVADIRNLIGDIVRSGACDQTDDATLG